MDTHQHIDPLVWCPWKARTGPPEKTEPPLTTNIAYFVLLFYSRPYLLYTIYSVCRSYLCTVVFERNCTWPQRTRIDFRKNCDTYSRFFVSQSEQARGRLCARANHEKYLCGGECCRCMIDATVMMATAAVVGAGYAAMCQQEREMLPGGRTGTAAQYEIAGGKSVQAQTWMH